MRGKHKPLAGCGAKEARNEMELPSFAAQNDVKITPKFTFNPTRTKISLGLKCIFSKRANKRGRLDECNPQMLGQGGSSSHGSWLNDWLGELRLCMESNAGRRCSECNHKAEIGWTLGPTSQTATGHSPPKSKCG